MKYLYGDGEANLRGGWYTTSDVVVKAYPVESDKVVKFQNDSLRRPVDA